jgi:hypothetical protein
MSDVNVELTYPANNALAMNDGIFRSLSGIEARQVTDTVINLSDLSNKTAFGGIISANSSNVISYGVIEREINMLANTDMFDCDVQWTANLISGAAGTLTTRNKQASYKVVGVQEQNVTSNVFVTATLSYKGKLIGTAQKYISFTINSLPPMLFVNGNTNVESVKFEPTSIATTLTATANVPGGQLLFRVDPMDAGVLISGNTVSLSAQAQQAGTDNVRNYSVLTELLFNNQIIAQDLKNVSLRALYAIPDINLTVPASTNNVFANVGLVRSSLTISGSHNVPGANLTWTATKVSGDDASLIVAANRGSANLTVSIADGDFGARKAVYDVVAALAYANGQPITSKTTRLTLRAAAYGMQVSSANDTQSGYTAQTAVASATVAFQAGTLTWTVARVSGDTAVFSTANSGTSGSASFNLSTSGVGTKTSVYRLTPTLTFDGVVMYNAPFDVSMTAQQNAYTFALSGATVNTQVGEAPVSSRIITTATHNVTGGTLLFSKSSSAGVLTSNSTSGTVTYSNNTIGIDNYTLSVELRDANNRTIETKTSAQTLRAYAPNLTFTGANTLTTTGFSDQSASLTSNVRVGVVGANTLAVTAQLLVGSTLTFNASGNSTLQTATLSTSRTTVGTNEGTYRLTGTVNYFGVLYSKTWDATLSVTKDDAQFAVTGSGQTLSSFNFPVVANGVVNASHVIPGGIVSWSRSGTGTVSAVPVQNNSQLVFNTSQGSVGSASAAQTVTATLRDADGNYVDQKSVVVNTSATVNNPALVLNGPTSNVVTNTFFAAATVIATPSVAAALTGHTYRFDYAPTSGALSSVTSNSSAVNLYAQFDGAGETRGSYNVVCSVILNGQTIATASKNITVAAVCPAPTLEYAGNPSASSGSFNFPVNNWAWFDAATTPAGGTFSWSWNLVSGVQATNIYTENNNSRLVVQNSQSDYGGKTSTYDVTCTYRTPNGTVLGTRTQRISTYSERYNPNLSLNYVNGNSAGASGFDERLNAPVSLQASTNPALGGHQFRITPVFVGGNLNQADFDLRTDSGWMTVTAYNLRSQNGTNAKSSQYDLYVDVVLNGQVISGQAVQRTYHTITPGSVSGVGNFNIYRQVWNGTSSAQISFNPDGVCYATDGNRTWMSPSNPGEAANFEVSFNNGASYQALTSAATISVSATGSASRPSNARRQGTYIIRNRWSGAVAGSGTYDMYVEVGTPV